MDPSGQEANSYFYADANPISKVDPSGLNAIDLVLDMISFASLADAISSGDAGAIASAITAVLISTISLATCEGILAGITGPMGAIAGTGACAVVGEIISWTIIGQYT